MRSVVEETCGLVVVVVAVVERWERGFASTRRERSILDTGKALPTGQGVCAVAKGTTTNVASTRSSRLHTSVRRIVEERTRSLQMPAVRT
jgi:hypothetical protein